jgi:hypothetical protein
MKKILLILGLLTLLVPNIVMGSPNKSGPVSDNTAITTPSGFLDCIAASDTEKKFIFTGAASDTFAIIEDTANPVTYTHTGLTGDATTQYDLTNPSGDTHRYTYDGTGTDPTITATEPVPGTTIVLTGWAAANNGTFEVTGSGTDYFEVTNASGDDTDDNVTGVTVNTPELYTRTGGMETLKVNWTASTGTPSVKIICFRPAQQ